MFFSFFIYELLGEDGVISVSADRSVRVWQLRDSGQVPHYLPQYKYRKLFKIEGSFII